MTRVVTAAREALKTLTKPHFGSGYSAFSVMTTQFPKDLTVEIDRGLQLPPGVSLRMPPTHSAITDMASKARIFLEKSAENGSKEAEQFLRDVKKFRSDSKVTAVFVEGLTKKEGNAVYSSAILAEFFGYKIMTKELFAVKPVTILASEGFTPAIDPHQDVAISYDGRSKADLIVIAGIESGDKAKTYIVEADAIREKLSPEVIEILSKPIYITAEHYTALKSEEDSEKKDKFSHFPIFTTNDQGANEMFLGNNFYGPDPRIEEFSKKATEALSQLFDVIEKMIATGEIKKFGVAVGSQLIIFNYRCLHGREAAYHPGVTRRVDISGYSIGDVDPSNSVDATDYSKLASPEKIKKGEKGGGGRG
jgi:hypothetical protein